jgi:hypothetical protein
MKHLVNYDFSKTFKTQEIDDSMGNRDEKNNTGEGGKGKKVRTTLDDGVRNM